MHRKVLNDVNPSPDTVRQWGYDEQLLLIEQDEDLILGDVEYVQVLLELAGDPACPKGEYALEILGQYCRFLLKWRHRALHRELAAEVLRRAEEAVASPSARVRAWHAWFREAVSSVARCDRPAS